MSDTMNLLRRRNPIRRLLLVGAMLACDNPSRKAKTVDTGSSTHAEGVVTPRGAVPARADAMPREVIDSIPSITVCVERRDPLVVYHYTVHNSPQALLRVIEIGLGEPETDNPDGGGELSIVPAGQSIDWSDSERRLSPPGVITPPHWYAEADRVEETSGFLIGWFAEAEQYGIPRRHTLAGFSIAVPHRDSGYVKGHWRMLHDAPFNLGGRLQEEPGDSSCNVRRRP